MIFFKLGLLLIAVSLFIFACSQNSATNLNVADNAASAGNSNIDAASPAANDELSAARMIYSEKCAKCHKEDGSGGISEIDGEKIKAPNFHSERMKKEDDKEFLEVIKKGAKEDGMPPFEGKLSDEEIKNLVKLIRRDFQNQ